MVANPEVPKINREYEQSGALLGSRLERLGCPAASALPPEILIDLGIRTYKPQMHPFLEKANSRIRELAVGSGRSVCDINRLIGRINRYRVTHYDGSSVVAGLKRLAISEAMEMEEAFGQLYAYKAVLQGTIVPRAGIRYRLSPDNEESILLTDLSGQEVAIPVPQHAIDLCPGLSAFPKIMPKGEATFTPNYTIIDNSLFTVAALKKGAGLFHRLGVTPGYGTRLSIVIDPMSLALAKFLNEGLQADLILASMIHTAGKAELGRVMQTSFHLLRPGGRLILQSPDQNNNRLPDAEWLNRLAVKNFGGSPERVGSMSLQNTRGEKFAGISATYRKN